VVTTAGIDGTSALYVIVVLLWDADCTILSWAGHCGWASAYHLPCEKLFSMIVVNVTYDKTYLDTVAKLLVLNKNCDLINWQKDWDCAKCYCNLFCKFDTIGFLYYIMLQAHCTTVFSNMNAIML